MKNKLTFSLIWGFIVSQLCSLLIVTALSVYGPDVQQLGGLFYLISFILGVILFLAIKKFFYSMNWTVGIISLIIAIFCFIFQHRLAIELSHKVMGNP